MSVPVRFVDKEGNTVKEFSSLKVAAAEAGCTASTLGWRIRHKSVFKGLHAEYMPKEYSEVQEKRRRQYRECVARKKMSDDSTLKVCGVRDDMTNEQKEKVIAELLKKGCSVEVVKYELRNGVLPITPCRKRDNGNSTVWPMVGSMKCVGCRYFKGRCRETREVICGFNYKK
jgi:hypothetical protein